MHNCPHTKDFYDYLTQLRNERSMKEPAWNEISMYFAGVSNPYNLAYSLPTGQLMDSSSVLAGKMLAAAFLGMMINPNDRNIELKHIDDKYEKDRDTTKFTQYIAKRLMDFLLDVDTGFYSKAHEFLTEYVNYGQATMIVDQRAGKVRFITSPTTATLIDVDDESVPDTGAREFQWTLRQLNMRYPMDEYEWPKSFSTTYKTDPLHKVWLVHAVMPKDNCMVAKKLGRQYDAKKPFVHVVAARDEEHIFEIKGISIQTFITARFDRLAGEMYGVGPGEYALPDVRTVNKMGQLNIDAVERQVRPPRYAPAQGWLSPIDDEPSSLTLYDSLGGEELKITSMGVEGNPQIGLEFVDRHTSSMYQLFYGDRLRQLQKKAEVKELELMSDKEERTRDLAPQLARLETEWFKKVIGNVLHYKLKDFIKDYEGSVPTSFGSEPISSLKITLRSPLARAQKMLEATNAKRLVDQFLVPLAQIDQTALSTIEMLKFVKYLLEMFYIPEEIRTPDEEYEAAKEQSNREKAITQGAANLNEASQGIKNLAQAQQANPGFDPSQLLQGLG